MGSAPRWHPSAEPGRSTASSARGFSPCCWRRPEDGRGAPGNNNELEERGTCSFSLRHQSDLPRNPVRETDCRHRCYKSWQILSLVRISCLHLGSATLTLLDGHESVSHQDPMELSF